MSILYIRNAVGKKGKIIKVPKLRTMCYNAESKFHQLTSTNGRDGLGKIVNDPRITPLGKFLRKYWIDELPQLWNVCITHDMSFVGIRPMNETHLKYYPEDIQKEILKYKPGLIPPGYRRKADTFEEHVNLMREYFSDLKEHPIKAKVDCFFDVLYQITIKRMRSK